MRKEEVDAEQKGAGEEEEIELRREFKKWAC